MPNQEPSTYSLHRFREICSNVHCEPQAILLRDSLPQVPIPIIDRFFASVKLSKPSGPDERESADLVRLTLIAFAPHGSEPAKLRGSPIPRYSRSRAESPDPTGMLRLYPGQHTSPILKDIVAALGVTDLIITSPLWARQFFADPFPLRSLSLSWRGTEADTQSGLGADLRELFAVLPEGLKRLSIEFGPSMPFSASGIGRLRHLEVLHIRVKSLPEGIDFSRNTALKSLNLSLDSEGEGKIMGLGDLPALQDLSISGPWSGAAPKDGADEVVLEAIDGFLAREAAGLRLTGVRYAADAMEGILPKTLSLSSVSGVKRAAFRQGASREADAYIKRTSLESLEIRDGGSLDVRDCNRLVEITAQLNPKSLTVEGCSALLKIDFSLAPCSLRDIRFTDLPSLAVVAIEAPEVNMEDAFKIAKCGMVKLPEFRGGWKGLKSLQLIGNPALTSISGIEALPDLAVLEITSEMVDPGGGGRKKVPRVSHDSLKTLFSGPPPAAGLKSVSTLTIEHAALQTIIGIESFTNVSSVALRSLPIANLDGMETLTVLHKADLSGSKMTNLAALAGLPNLAYLKLSGCDGLEIKPPHTVMEGLELSAELARHVPATGIVRKKALSSELSSVVQLIGEGKCSDVFQAMQLLPALTSEEKSRLVMGASISRETGWINLPFLPRLKGSQVKGIPQLRILQMVDTSECRALLSSVTTLLINATTDGSPSTMCLGDREGYSGAEEGLFEEFTSLGALPHMPNVSSIQVHALPKFSLDGAENFPKLTTCRLSGITQLESLSSLERCASLETLYLSGLSLKDLSGLGRHAALRSLSADLYLKSIKGLDNFPSLERFQVHSCEDISALADYAKQRGCRVSYLQSGSGFSFHAAK